jgi:hypothetical protein
MAVGQHRQQDSLRPRTHLVDLPRRIDAVQFWHGNIEHRGIRTKLFRKLDGLLAIIGFGDNIEAGLLQEKLQSLPHHNVIIRE